MSKIDAKSYLSNIQDSWTAKERIRKLLKDDYPNILIKSFEIHIYPCKCVYFFGASTGRTQIELSGTQESLYKTYLEIHSYVSNKINS